MPQNPRGRNERAQEQREQDSKGARRHHISNDRSSRNEEHKNTRNNRQYRSTILSSIDYDRNAE